MTVKDLILTYGLEEILIEIINYEDDKYLIPCMWKSDYTEISSGTGEYIYKSFHQYDESEVLSWDIDENKLKISI